MLLISESFYEQLGPAFISGDEKKIDIALASIGISAKSKYEASRGVARIGVWGILSKSTYGGTNYADIIQGIADANADPLIDKIHLEINSPGGYQAGIMQVMNAVKNSSKEVIAYVDDLCASAAYMIASQCSKIIARHSLSEFGSVGVALHLMDSKGAYEKAGWKVEVYTNSQSKKKRPKIGTPEGDAVIQKELDASYEIIEAMVATGRKIDQATLRANFGEGQTFFAKEAQERKMIDEELTENNANPNLKKETSKMSDPIKTSAELSAKYPALCKELEDAAVSKQTESNKEWTPFAKVDPERVAKAIDDGEKMTHAAAADLTAKLNAMNAKEGTKPQTPAQNMADDNPQDFQASDNGLSAEDQELKEVIARIEGE